MLLRALGPIESPTVLPLPPSVVTTTALFSRTSRSLRPRHRTTTLILVSSPPSDSNSRSLRLVPAVVAEVPTEDRDSAGETAPPRSILCACAWAAAAAETAADWCLVLVARIPWRTPTRAAAPGRTAEAGAGAGGGRRGAARPRSGA